MVGQFCDHDKYSCYITTQYSTTYSLHAGTFAAVLFYSTDDNNEEESDNNNGSEETETAAKIE